MKVKVAVAALLALASACSAPGVKVDGMEIADVQKVIASLDRNFKNAVSTENNVHVGASARCYFLDIGDGAINTEGAFCGPVRRFGTAEGEVWDRYDLEVATVDGKARISTRDAASSTSVEVPDIAKLTRPDGESAPSDAARLSLPKAPAGDADLYVQTSATLDGEFLPLASGPGFLVAPSIKITVVGVSHPADVSLATSDSSTDGESFVSAPEGTQLATYHFKIEDGATQPDYKDNDSTPSFLARASVTVGTQHHELTLPSGTRDYLRGDGTPTEIYATVAVPDESENVSLDLSVDGQAQHLNLVTGQFSSELSTADYRETRVQELNFQQPTVEIPVDPSGCCDFKIQQSGTISSAYITGFDASRGWAPKGKAWLEVVGAYPSYDARSAGYAARLTSDPILKDAAGHALPYASDGGQAGTAVFLVPGDFTAGTFSYSPVFRWGGRLGGENGTVKGQPFSLRLTFSAASPLT